MSLFRHMTDSQAKPIFLYPAATKKVRSAIVTGDLMYFRLTCFFRMVALFRSYIGTPVVIHAGTCWSIRSTWNSPGTGEWDKRFHVIRSTLYPGYGAVYTLLNGSAGKICTLRSSWLYCPQKSQLILSNLNIEHHTWMKQALKFVMMIVSCISWTSSSITCDLSY